MNHLFSLIRSRMPALERTFIETGDGRGISYGEILALSGRMANTMCDLGVAPGDRVAVQVEKSPEAIALYLACLRAGAIYLPLNPAYSLAEVAHYLQDAEPRLTICSPGSFEGIGKIASGVRTAVETLEASGGGSFMAKTAQRAATFADTSRAAGDIAAILYTSGTTGRSKGAMISHENLACNALALTILWQFSRDDVLLHALPIFHTNGLFVATNVVLLSAASMIFLPKFDAGEVMRLMPRATTMMGVPTFYVRLLRHPELSRATAAHMRLFVSGSAPLLAETHAAWQQRTGHAILERYGLTETNINTSNPYGGDRRAGAVGLPLPGVSVRVTNPETGEALAQGEIGMIEVKGPNVFKGYWRMPERTRTDFRADGFFITGDLGRFDSSGYLSILGRSTDLVISGGYNVYPKEVENEIDAVSGVAESAVIGLPHADFGEAVTAIVVKGGKTDIDEQTVLAALASRLAKYKRPKRVLFVDDLPRNAMGKVQKNLLRARYKDLYASTV